MATLQSPTTSTEIAIATTSHESVPAEPPPSRRGRWLAVALGALAVGGLGIVAGNEVEVPYYAIGPGGVIPAGPLVEVVGGPSYPAEGMFFPTVSLSRDRLTVLGATEGWLDPDVDVVEERSLLPPDVDPDELRELNLSMMTASKDKALGVAFERIGVDVFRADGAGIIHVVPDSPAGTALRIGDVIVDVAGAAVTTSEDAVAALGTRRPGDRVTIGFRRGDEQRTVDVTLAENPEEPGRPLLGVVMETHNDLDLPFEVKVGSEDIGGPSAGLAFTLQILDELTEGRLTGDLRVVATGEIQLDGSVTDVGGVSQKAVAVREAGVDVFLVPTNEAEQARQRVGDHVRVEAVDSLDDALAVLERLGGDPLVVP